jgi:hypothetical protein
MLPRDVWPASSGSTALRLEHLYRIRFTYPESWMVELEGGWEQHLFLAEGRCEGSISGRFRGANFPQRRTAAGPFLTFALLSIPSRRDRPVGRRRSPAARAGDLNRCLALSPGGRPYAVDASCRTYVQARSAPGSADLLRTCRRSELSQLTKRRRRLVTHAAPISPR